MRYLLLACAGLISIGAADQPRAPRTVEAQAKLDKWLGGRVAFETKTCVPVHATANPIGIDDNTMLFRDGPRIWRNDLRRTHDCGKLDKQSVVVTASTVGRMCDGDDIGIYHNGQMVGACTLGSFVLYKKP